VFDVYDAWAGSREEARRSVARGQEIFNNRPITISGVAGLNFASPFNPPLPASFQGACTTCHDSPNAGNHSIVAPLNIACRRVAPHPDMPAVHAAAEVHHPRRRQQVVGPACPQMSVTGPGRALISGQFAGRRKFRARILRGLAARAPYFHNGSAADLGEVIDFYNERFGAGIPRQDREDLIAFLRAL